MTPDAGPNRVPTPLHKRAGGPLPRPTAVTLGIQGKTFSVTVGAWHGMVENLRPDFGTAIEYPMSRVFIEPDVLVVLVKVVAHTILRRPALSRAMRNTPGLAPLVVFLLTESSGVDELETWDGAVLTPHFERPAGGTP